MCHVGSASDPGFKFCTCLEPSLGSPGQLGHFLNSTPQFGNGYRHISTPRACVGGLIGPWLNRWICNRDMVPHDGKEAGRGWEAAHMRRGAHAGSYCWCWAALSMFSLISPAQPYLYPYLYLKIPLCHSPAPQLRARLCSFFVSALRYHFTVPCQPRPVFFRLSTDTLHTPLGPSLSPSLVATSLVLFLGMCFTSSPSLRRSPSLSSPRSLLASPTSMVINHTCWLRFIQPVDNIQ